MEIVKSPDYIYINGISSDTVGLYIDTPPVPPMAIRRGSNINVGGEADIYSLENGYDDISVKVRAYSFYPADFDNSEIYKFLSEAATLQTSRLSKFYYNVKRVSSVNASSAQNGEKIIYDITFLCEPFKYYVDNPEIAISSGDIIENKGKLFSRPVFHMTISGKLTLDVNGTQLIVENSDSDRNITIDSRNGRMIAHSGNNLLKTSGYFPLFSTGFNRISWIDSTVATATVLMNARCY